MLLDGARALSHLHTAPPSVEKGMQLRASTVSCHPASPDGRTRSHVMTPSARGRRGTDA
jgi:hypothetical protein